MERGFKIDELIGDNWNIAVTNVMEILNIGRSDKLFYQRDRFYVERMAMDLGVRFDSDGNIIK